MKAFLEGRAEVGRVYYPEVDGQQLTGYPGILFFELDRALAGRYEAFRDALKLFGSGTALASVTSMIAQPFTGSHASMNSDEKAAMGIGVDLVRLSFGLEHEDDLRADLARAFAAVHAPAATAAVS
jgi:cystathionine gamma-lyase/cystathionine gamma-lyase/homocysteine desulfhydrase